MKKATKRAKTVEKETMTEQEFCDRVGICRMTAFRLREAGKLPHCKIGRRILYLPRHVYEFLDTCERPGIESRNEL
jgi:hypothetical protein